MKTLSAFNTTATDNPNTEPIYLVTIEFSGLTLYLCDRVFGTNDDCVWQSNIYQPLVVSYDTIELGKLNPVTYELEPSNVSFVLDNSTPIGGATNFTALFSTYDAQYTTVTISMIFSGAGVAGDEIDLFKGQIEDILNMQQDQLSVTCSGSELDLANKFAHEIIDTTTYANADPDDVGKMLPQVWGTAKKVPFLGIDVGALTTLSQDVTSTGGTINLTDSSSFPASGTILIDSEQITYNGNAGNALTVTARAANDTQAIKHVNGAKVGEIQTEYVYAIGQGVKSIDAVYIDNVLQDASEYTAYRGMDGDDHATYANRAIISFPTWPDIKRASVEGVFSISREAPDMPMGRIRSLDKSGGILDYDTRNLITHHFEPTGTHTDIYVDYEFEFRHIISPPDEDHDFKIDGILIASWLDGEFTQFVSSPLRVRKVSWPGSAGKTASFRASGGSGTGFTVLSATVYATSDTDDTGNRGKPGSLGATNLPVGEFSSRAIGDTGSSVTFPGTPGGVSNETITVSWDAKMWGRYIFEGTPYHLSIDGINVAWVSRSGTVTNLMPNTFSYPHLGWAAFLTKTPSVLDEWGRGLEFVVRTATQSYHSTVYTEDVQLTGNSMGDAVIGSRIACDVKGYQDNGAGDYTGTPDASINRPDWILKHILVAKCGLGFGDLDDAGSYSDAGTYYNANSITLAPVILEPPSVRALCQRIAYQARSLQFWEAGVHKLIHMPDTETTDRYLDANRIDLNQIWVQYTPRVDIKNTLTSRYARDWSGYSDNIEADQLLVTATAAASVATYGTLYGEANLNYVTGATQAQLILNWIGGEWDTPRLMVELSGGYYLTDLERGDIIGFSLGMDAGVVFFDDIGTPVTWDESDDIDWHETLTTSELKQALLNLISGQQFRVVDKIYRPDASQQIQMVEI